MSETHDAGGGVTPGIRRVPGLDGIRGLAVAAVVAYHFFPAALPGGYVGVDMFFVLSGFLITSLLLREKAATGVIRLSQFWLRRARRILPAAITVLLVMAAVTGIIGGDPAVGLATQVFSSLAFINNWVQIAGSHSYFSDQGVQVFAHYWSLMVEEQFYLVWPLIVVAATWRSRWWPVGAIAAVGGVLSAVWMALAYHPDQDPTRVYYGTDTHCFGLLAGALTAWAVTSLTTTDSFPANKNRLSTPRKSVVVGVLCIVGLGVVWLTMPDTAAETYRGGLVAASVLTAGLIAATVAPASPIAAVLSTRWLRWLGQRSFSLYLWHWPIVVLLRWMVISNGWDIPRWAIGIAAIIISVPLAAWSFRCIETPFHKQGYIATLRSFMPSADATRRHSIKVALVISAVTLTACGAGAAMMTAPKQTSLEADLNALAAATETAPPPVAPTTTAPPTPTRHMPAGTEITAIGDSVMLASSQALQKSYPGLVMDAKVSRAMVSSPPVINQLKANGQLRRFVLLGFGTNSPLGDDVFDSVMTAIGPDHVVVVTYPYGDRWWIPKAQESIQAAVKKYPNLYVSNWCEKARADHSLLRTDMIHPTLEGASAYAAAVTQGLQNWVDEKPQPTPAACGL